jgi:hypothetical protein
VRRIYLIEDVEESICEGSISESFETKCFQNGESLIEFVFGDHTVLRAVSEGFFDDLEHLLIFCLLI